MGVCVFCGPNNFRLMVSTSYPRGTEVTHATRGGPSKCIRAILGRFFLCLSLLWCFCSLFLHLLSLGFLAILILFPQLGFALGVLTYSVQRNWWADVDYSSNSGRVPRGSSGFLGPSLREMTSFVVPLSHLLSKWPVLLSPPGALGHLLGK